MESLALVVAIMVFICMFSGPIALVLASKLIRGWTSHIALLIIRRIIMGVINFLGLTLSSFFLSAQVGGALKIIALISMVLNVWAIDREYGGSLTAKVKQFFQKRFKGRRNPHGPSGQD